MQSACTLQSIAIAANPNVPGSHPPDPSVHSLPQIPMHALQPHRVSVFDLQSRQSPRFFHGKTKGSSHIRYAQCRLIGMADKVYPSHPHPPYSPHVLAFPSTSSSSISAHSTCSSSGARLFHHPLTAMVKAYGELLDLFLSSAAHHVSEYHVLCVMPPSHWPSGCGPNSHAALATAPLCGR
jgi:hypothetical protein